MQLFENTESYCKLCKAVEEGIASWVCHYHYKIIQLIVCDGALYLADQCLQNWTMVAGGGFMCSKALPAHKKRWVRL